MARVIDQGAHRKGCHVFSGEGPEQCVESVYVLECGIEPGLVVLRGENDRHAVVDRLHEYIRLRGDDRTGFKRLSFGWFPVFPQAREGKRTFTLQADPHGLLLFPL